MRTAQCDQLQSNIISSTVIQEPCNRKSVNGMNDLPFVESVLSQSVVMVMRRTKEL